MCHAFSQATARIHPTHVTVPPGVLPLTGSSDTEWERWASFVTWILRERATLTHFTVHVSFTQAHQVRVLIYIVLALLLVSIAWLAERVSSFLEHWNPCWNPCWNPKWRIFAVFVAAQAHYWSASATGRLVM